MRYYCAYLLRVVRTSSLRCSTIFALLALRSLSASVPFSILSSSHLRLLFFFDHHGFISLSLSFVTTGRTHGRRGFPQAHSVRLAYHGREEETKERIEFRFAVEAVAVTRSKRRRRRRTTTIITSTTRTRTTRTTTTTESLRPVRVAENASAKRVPAFEVVVV